MIGDEITDIESSRDSPFRWYGYVVCVGVDLATDLEWTIGSGVKLVRSFRGVALGAKPDHDPAPLLNVAGSTVGVDGRFEFGVVGRNFVVDVPVEFCEVGGVSRGLVRMGSRCRKVDEVDM